MIAPWRGSSVSPLGHHGGNRNAKRSGGYTTIPAIRCLAGSFRLSGASASPWCAFRLDRLPERPERMGLGTMRDGIDEARFEGGQGYGAPKELEATRSRSFCAQPTPKVSRSSNN